MSSFEEFDAFGWAGTSPAGEAASVTRFLLDLRALGARPVPEPSDELAALLGRATPPPARDD